MGLDIYAHKTSVGKGVNASSVEELSRYHDKRATENFRRKVDRLVGAIKDKQTVFNSETPLEVYRAAVMPLYNYLKKTYRDYAWYYEWLNCEEVEDLHPDACKEYIAEKKKEQHIPSLEEFNKHIADLKKGFFARADVYFRKVNFVYAYFMDRLEDEACTFDKNDVIDIIDRCVQIIDAAARCNEEWFDEKHEHINPKFYWDYYTEERLPLSAEIVMVAPAETEEEQKEREQEKKRGELIRQKIDEFTKSLDDSWTKVAEELLPTQCGFFFGSTDYNAYYLADVLDCRKQFTELLNNWKENDAAYIEMSW